MECIYSILLLAIGSVPPLPLPLPHLPTQLSLFLLQLNFNVHSDDIYYIHTACIITKINWFRKKSLFSP